jgi:hypothetical protein
MCTTNKFKTFLHLIHFFNCLCSQLWNALLEMMNWKIWNYIFCMWYVNCVIVSVGRVNIPMRTSCFKNMFSRRCFPYMKNQNCWLLLLNALFQFIPNLKLLARLNKIFANDLNVFCVNFESNHYFIISCKP